MVEPPTPALIVGLETAPRLEACAGFGFLGDTREAGACAGKFMASTMSSSTAWYSPVASVAGASLAAGGGFSNTAGAIDGAGSIAPGSNLNLSSFSPTNQTQRMPVILSSSKISVLTVSTVMVGPPDFSTARSPDLKTVMVTIYCHQSEANRSDCAATLPNRSNLTQISAAVINAIGAKSAGSSPVG